MDVLITGATGYVGSRLVPRLLDAGHTVRALVRDPARLDADWRDQVAVHTGDLLEPEGLADAFDGADAAAYLVHSVGGAAADFGALDRRLADAFAALARDAGVGHVVYLGGLMPSGGAPSEHLRSRAEVGERLAARVPTTELRAGPIIGPGSGSFDMVRYLVDRLPVMVAPRWIDNPVQPIATGDVLSYLAAALKADPAGIVDIGGADVVTFREMMRTYARLTGKRRLIVKVPLLVPRVAALWVGLVTPIPNRLAVPLVEGITHPVVADTARARKLYPDVEPVTYGEAVEAALDELEAFGAPSRLDAP